MIGALFNFIIYALAIGLLLWLIQWILAQFPVPHPFGKIIWIAAVVLAVLFLIMLLLDLSSSGSGVGRFPRLIG